MNIIPSQVHIILTPWKDIYTLLKVKIGFTPELIGSVALILQETRSPQLQRSLNFKEC